MDRKVYARIAVTYFFVLEGSTMGTWSSELSQLQDNLDLSDGDLGVAALFVYLGSVLATFPASVLIRKYGSQYPTLLSAIFFCISLPLIALSDTFPILILTMFCYGFSMGIMDVSMNASGIATEIMYDVLIFSTFHGSYSFAAAGGSFLGGALESVGLSIFLIFLIVSSTLLGLSLLAGYNLYTQSMEEAILEQKDENCTKADSDAIIDTISSEEKTPPSEAAALAFLSSHGSGYLCAVGFLAAFGESVMITWCAIYLDRYINDSAVVASIGLSVFMIFMGLGRFSSDYLRQKFGAKNIIRYAGCFASAGLSMLLISSWLVEASSSLGLATAFIGIAFVGIGLSTLIPTVFITAGRLPGVEPSSAIAQLSIFTNLGSVSGPPLIGFASTLLSSLRYALIIDTFFLLCISFFSIGIVAPLFNKDEEKLLKIGVADYNYKQAPNVLDSSSIENPLLS